MKQSIRIIGGKYRGKKLFVPNLEGLRPTPDRVRETLFNWLMHDIRDACCLDAFAGSGALGFEAYSRGASSVVFIESADEAYVSLRKQVRAFATTQLTVLHQDAFIYLQNTQQQFDIVFLDPPFANDYLTPCIQHLTNFNVLKSGGLLYVESSEIVNLDFQRWEPLKLKQAGKVMYGLYKKLIKI
jgi:16S rRNA (guanine966-N2)-methyltransferase